MNQEVIKIDSIRLPFGLDEKIFGCACDDDCDCSLMSYNDFVKCIESFSGINPELLGKNNVF